VRTTDAIAAAAERSAMADDLLDVMLRLAPTLRPAGAAAQHLGASVQACFAGGRLRAASELVARLCTAANAALYASPAAPFGDPAWLLPPLLAALRPGPEALTSIAAAALARLADQPPHCTWLATHPLELRSLLAFACIAGDAAAAPALRAAAGCVCDALRSVAGCPQLAPACVNAFRAEEGALCGVMVAAGEEAGRVGRLLAGAVFG
jgi:hypothetical protein